MNIKISTPYSATRLGTRHEVSDWPEDWPPPSVGDVVYDKDGCPLYVRHVTWYPSGHPGGDGDAPEPPFIVVSLSDRRPY